MLPRLSSSELVSRWITVTLALSILAVLDGGWLASWLALSPSRIWRGELWRLATWMLIEQGALPLLLTCAAIYKLGGDLAMRWGDRRLRRYVIEVIGAAGLATALLAWVSGDAWHMYRLGGWAVGDVLVIAWARQFPYETIRLYGLLELQGRKLVAVTVGATILYAVYGGVFTTAPELIACAAAVWYPEARLARRG